MPRYTGTLYLPFDIEYASTDENADLIVDSVITTFGHHDFKHLGFTWDNPDWSITAVEEDTTNG